MTTIYISKNKKYFRQPTKFANALALAQPGGLAHKNPQG